MSQPEPYLRVRDQHSFCAIRRPVSLLSLAQAPAAPAATPATPAPPVIPFLPAIVPVAALPAPLASSVVLRATPAPTPAGVALPPQLDVFGLWTFWAPLAARDAPSAERAAAMQAVIEAAEECVPLQLCTTQRLRYLQIDTSCTTTKWPQRRSARSMRPRTKPRRSALDHPHPLQAASESPRKRARRRGRRCKRSSGP